MQNNPRPRMLNTSVLPPSHIAPCPRTAPYCLLSLAALDLLFHCVSLCSRMRVVVSEGEKLVASG